MGIYALRPVQFFDEWRGIQKSAIGAVKDVEKPIAIGLQQQTTCVSIIFEIREHRRFICVVVEKIMRSELKIPLQFPGLGVDSKNASCIEIVPWAGISHKIRRRIA